MHSVNRPECFALVYIVVLVYIVFIVYGLNSLYILNLLIANNLLRLEAVFLCLCSRLILFDLFISQLALRSKINIVHYTVYTI